MFSVMYKRHVGSQWKMTEQTCRTFEAALAYAEAKLALGYFRVRVVRLVKKHDLTPDD